MADVARLESEKGWRHCEKVMYNSQDRQNVVLAGFAAVQAIDSVLSDAYFFLSDDSKPISDFDVDPYEHDSSFLAAAAYSNGAVWDKGSNADKREEFWNWWLKEAVPMS